MTKLCGDVVLLADERVPRGQWPLGRVVRTHSDTAGNVRSVDVKTGKLIQNTTNIKVVSFGRKRLR